ncbi:MAG: hypothetical protein GXY03_15470 [Solirubrobacterales bacterium]|nr:hypothetical protein [Solirubrobacterales bacterium]
MRRTAATLLATALTAVAAPSALAAPADGTGPSAHAAAAPVINVVPSVVPRGERVAIRGHGWTPGARVRLAIGPPESDADPFAVVRVNRRGRFVKRVTFRGPPALWIVVACEGRSCKRVDRAKVRVVKPAKKGQKTLLHTDRPQSRYLERPRRVGYEGFSIPGNVDSIDLLRLRWSSWGGGKATATGRARVCANGACKTVGASATARKRVRYESREWFYSRVTLRLRADAGIGMRRVILCTLPALCGGRPGPP